MDSPDALKFNGETTNLSEAVNQLNKRMIPDNVQAVILITDGNFTVGKNPLYDAEAMGIPMVVGAAVRQMLAVTKARFGADSDFTNVARVLEEWAGVEIKG